MAARSKARKRALDVLFAAEAQRRGLAETLEEELAGDRPVNDYTSVLVTGVAQHAAEIDEIITRFAQGWSLDRMPAVDRNVLRLGVFEVLYADDVPVAVAVSESVKLVRELSTDESPAFVNGLLAHVVRERKTLV